LLCTTFPQRYYLRVVRVSPQLAGSLLLVLHHNHDDDEDDFHEIHLLWHKSATATTNVCDQFFPFVRCSCRCCCLRQHSCVVHALKFEMLFAG